MHAPRVGNPRTLLGPLTFSTLMQILLDKQAFPGAQQNVTSSESLQGMNSSATPPFGKKHGLAARQNFIRLKKITAEA